MKKIIFLLLVCLIKLNAYEYEFFNNQNWWIRYYIDSRTNTLEMKSVVNNSDGTQRVSYVNSFYDFINSFSFIRRGAAYYISKTKFENYYKNDLNFLNDLYSTNQAFLNYLYNPSSVFSNTNYIKYEDYEFLYNSDGLIVESIVNGNWAGLYDDAGQSGYLYNEKGELLYVNGEPASFLEKINEKLLKRFKINLESIFIKKIFYPLLVLIFACVVLRSVIRLALQSFLIRFYDKKISQLEKRREKIENA